MSARATRNTLVFFVLTFAAISAFAADEPAKAPESAPAAAAAPAAETGEKLTTSRDRAKEAGGEWENHWYFIWGAANVYPKLEDSIRKINKEINGPMNMLFPNWEKPTTFRDWRDKGMLWDFHVGAGRDLGQYFSVYATTGYIRGVVKSEEDYMLWLPAKTKVKFQRDLGFVMLGAQYYPFKKAVFNTDPECCYFARVAEGIRPYFELATCYVHLTAFGSGKVKVPLFGTIYKKGEYTDYNLSYLSPRMGVEIPLGRSDSITLAGGYSFYLMDAREFNGPAMFIMHKHKF